MRYILAIFSLSLLGVAVAIDCSSSRLGRYCTSNTNFEWCHSRGSPSVLMSCPSGTVCACSYSESGNPCVPPGYDVSALSDCEAGNPGVNPAPAPRPPSSANPAPTPRPPSSTNPSPTPRPPSSPTVPTQVPGTPPASNVCSSNTRRPSNYKFVTYFTNWAQYRTGNCKYSASSLPGGVVTHINFAFAKVNGQTYELEPYEWNDVTDPMNGVQKGNFDQVNELKSVYPGLKTLISIGGWNFNFLPATKSIFTTMAASSTYRRQFINSCIQFARKYNFDGIDLDWEYPGDPDQGGRPQDTPNFSLLLQEMRAAINAENLKAGQSRLLFTIAAPAGQGKYSLMELNKIHSSLDWINVMTYDLHGSWDPVTGYHTALYCNDGLCIDAAVNGYLNAGVPASKIVVGMGTYGRSWTLSNPSSNGVGAPARGAGAQGSCTAEPGFLAYYEIRDMISQGAREICDVNTACYTSRNDLWVSYDNEQTLTAKVNYVVNKRLGGAMVWAADLDSPVGAGGHKQLQCTIANALGSGSPTRAPSLPSAGSDSTIQDVYSRPSSTHLPASLSFSKTNYMAQLRSLVESPTYRDASVYKPSTISMADLTCSFHALDRQGNLNQLLIGRPTKETMSISNTPDLTIRLPDRYFGLFLAYAMDHYGLNPAMLLGLAAKESFYPVIYSSQAGNRRFLVDNENDKYDCFAPGRNGLCTDGNKDGPFQVETPAMSTDVSVFPTRFYVGPSSTPKDKREPSFLTDGEILQLPGFKAYHDSITTDPPRAIALTALDFHLRYNVIIRLRDVGMLQQYQARTNALDRGTLLFATAMYTYNRGLFDKTGLNRMLGSCGPGKHPIRDCGLDGYGGHSADIAKACTLVERASEVYDYEVTWADTEYFLKKLEETYPYSSVPGYQANLDWSDIQKQVKSAFDFLSARNPNTSARGKSVSFRYDWRPLVAVVRSHLPPREQLMGESLKSLDAYYGNSFANDLPPLSGVNEDVNVEAVENNRSEMNGSATGLAGLALIFGAAFFLI